VNRTGPVGLPGAGNNDVRVGEPATASSGTAATIGE
jgi:hypothetical protein